MIINNTDGCVIYNRHGLEEEIIAVVDSKTIFDVKIPDMDFSLESVFGELKSELMEKRVNRKYKGKQENGHHPKAKPKAEKIVPRKGRH